MSFTYFAYGSNMFTPKMRVPAPSAEFRVKGRLVGYVLRFNKRSVDGSGKANIVFTGRPDDEVRGVVFEIEDRDRSALDESEAGYDPVSMEVLAEDGGISAFTYIARPTRVDESLRPYTWYMEFVVRGAREHELLPDYVRTLESTPASEDPDPRRDRKNRDLLG